MKVCIICVNFNTESQIKDMIGSIKSSSDDVDIIIVNNSCYDLCEVDGLADDYPFNIKVIHSNDNLGYFGGLDFSQGYIDKYLYEYVILANPDIIFDALFFENLVSADYSDNVGVIAPRLLNMPSNTNGNPFMTERITKKSLQLKLLIHSSWLFYSIYNLAHYIKKKYFKKNDSLHEAGYIYAPHGALFIFSKSYFQLNDCFLHCGFLYGEELFVAEKCRENNIGVYFDPSLLVQHIEHASTSKLGNAKISKYARLSLRNIIRKYF
ncbi:hypothetical protein BCT41_14055 [Vibrio splendidus]|uniref:glycosyltransferase n=1 Tax=Vibrio splendidus TaxID=29497 RepID=UPI000C816BB2|nr:glycosyltransferase [Vibrio splendidus]PMM20010.1 hypothetical protein BCT62_00690 [Vibrio splendidus]PMM98506.1 hypothetical protein BCT41_14055 [Vibrio splendidus]PMN33097.1 hypothetical protein BCT36_05925 [Vibrio splendidus]